MVLSRRYLPTLAELIDRLTIVMLKSVHLTDNRQAYLKERDDIIHDINLLAKSSNNIGGFVQAIAAIMLANKTIWDNESKARQGGAEQNHLLRFTHSINGVRNTAKNIIARSQGERIDLKIDALAADLPKEFGNWNLFDAAG